MRATFDDQPARPRVIGTQTRALLDELRQFRHVVRNACSDRLRENDVMENIKRLKRALSLFEQDFGSFVAYMRGGKPAASRVRRLRASRRPIGAPSRSR